MQKKLLFAAGGCALAAGVFSEISKPVSYALLGGFIMALILALFVSGKEYLKRQASPQKQLPGKIIRENWDTILSKYAECCRYWEKEVKEAGKGVKASKDHFFQPHMTRMQVVMFSAFSIHSLFGADNRIRMEFLQRVFSSESPDVQAFIRRVGQDIDSAYMRALRDSVENNSAAMQMGDAIYRMLICGELAYDPLNFSNSDAFAAFEYAQKFYAFQDSIAPEVRRSIETLEDLI